MDFIDHLRILSARIATIRDRVQTEEATKNAMVMPFIQILGYDVFDPLEVTPELVADVGTKKGEKVDYAILLNDKPIILFECKKAGGDLSINHAGQLFRYFHVTEARFGVLTNGLVYRFFTDLEQPNKMDETPFFEFDVLDFKERDVEELKKFAKSAFDLDAILTTANDLKYTTAIQNRLAEWMAAPDEKFVRLLAADLIGNRKFTQPVIDQFTAITKRAFEQMLGARINDRLKGAMTPDTAPVAESDAAADSPIVTTAEEIEGFLSHRPGDLARRRGPSPHLHARFAKLLRNPLGRQQSQADLPADVQQREETRSDALPRQEGRRKGRAGIGRWDLPPRRGDQGDRALLSATGRGEVGTGRRNMNCSRIMRALATLRLGIMCECRFGFVVSVLLARRASEEVLSSLARRANKCTRLRGWRIETSRTRRRGTRLRGWRIGLTHASEYNYKCFKGSSKSDRRNVMRTTALLVSMALAGCAPKPEVENTPATDAEPAPLYVPSDNPHQAKRMVGFRDDEEPVLLGLARGEIRAGDPIEPLVLMVPQKPFSRVYRHGEYVTLHADPTGYGGTTLVAKNGKLVSARTSSCTFHDVFFDGMTEAERTVHGKSYSEEVQKQIALRQRPPAK